MIQVTTTPLYGSYEFLSKLRSNLFPQKSADPKFSRALSAWPGVANSAVHQYFDACPRIGLRSLRAALVHEYNKATCQKSSLLRPAWTI